MATLTEVFPCFFLSCKANSRVKPAKTGHGPHSSKCLCCMYCWFCVVPCIVCVYMCAVLLPPGGYPIAVKYIISNQYTIQQCTTDFTIIFYKLKYVLSDILRKHPTILPLICTNGCHCYRVRYTIVLTNCVIIRCRRPHRVGTHL